MGRRKFRKERIGKVSEKDIIRITSKVSREVFGIIPVKRHKNKKKYNRKEKHKSDLDLK